MGRHHVGGRESQWAAEWALIHGRWDAELMSDSHYSPNLSLDVFELWEPAFPPRVSYPWRPHSKELGAETEIAAPYSS